MKFTGLATLTRSLLLALALPSAAGLAQTTQFPGSTAVTGVSTAVSVTIHISTAGTAIAPVALTQGLTGADFAVGGGGSCTAGTPYNAGDQCTVNTVFQPVYPGMRSGAIVLKNASGTVLGETLLSALATGPLPAFAPGRIDTVAGNAYWLYLGDGGPANNSPIYLPGGLAMDAAGDLFLADSQNNRIRRVDGQTGIITTIGGTGTPGYNGDNLPAMQAMVSTPAGLAIDGAGNLYLADVGNHSIRRIDAFSGIITTVAGTPQVQGYTGDGQVATQATLSFPEAIALDAAGNLFIADTGNNCIREVDAGTGVIHTIAGTGAAGYNGDARAATAAQLNTPWGLTVAPDGTLYFADLGNNRVRRIQVGGSISTVAGTGARAFGGDGGDGPDAILSEPTAVALDPAGNLYIADSGNDRVREINATSGLITTICGDNTQQFAGDGGPANLAVLYGPSALLLDSAGNLMVSDMFHNRVRRISALATALLYPTMKVGKLSPPVPVLLANDGNADFKLTQPLFVNAEDDAASTTCTNGTVLASASTCNVGAVFAPTVIGALVNGSITVSSSSVYAPPVVTLSGEVLSIQPTSISITSSINPSVAGSKVEFDAAVANGLSPVGGSIAFLDGTNQICNVAINNAAAACSTSALTLGSHSITATYSGDANNAASTSAALIQVVKEQPVLTLNASPNPSVVTGAVMLSLSSAAPSGVITGTVAFYDGSNPIDAVGVSSSGSATYSTNSLTPGQHSLSVRYAGDALNLAAQSNVVIEVVQQAPTTTVLSSNAATVSAGATIKFTAQVTSANGPAPTGTVKFTSGSSVLGTSPVGSNGSATLSISTLAPNTYSIVAVYSGDINDATSTSNTYTEVVQQLTTTVALGSDANPVAAGAALHLAATVAGGTPAGGTLSGNVNFVEGTITWGSASVDSNGQANLTLSVLPAGHHSLVAKYAGNTNYAASTSAPLPQVVDSTGTTVALSSPAATTLAGENATFTATVSSLTAVPTGNVVFKDNQSSIGQVQLNAQGVATFSTATLTVGPHSITAAYAGDGSYEPNTSAALAHTIVLATTALTLAGPGGTIEAGKAFTMKATLTSNGLNPTGALNLRDSGAVIGTQTIAADGTFAFSGVTLAVGNHTLTATYAGDANDADATSAAVVVVVGLAPTTTTVVTSASPATLGASITFTATISTDSPNPTGTVNFMDGTTLLGSSPVANGSAKLNIATLSFGSHSISAVYSGDINHATSTSSSLTQLIVQAATVTVGSNLNPSDAGATVTFTARITGSGPTTPTGTILFLDGQNAIGTVSLDGTGSAILQTAALILGTHTVTASYSGDTNYSVASAVMVQTVQSASTQVTLAASANPATYATPVSFTATVTGNGGIAAGSVTFTDSGVTLGVIQLNSGGVAVLTTSSLAPGSHSVVANYGGNSSTGASISTPTVVTVKETTAVTLHSNLSPASTLAPIVLTASVSNNGVGVATGVVTFTDGPTQLGTMTLDASGTATLTLPSLVSGNHVLQASYAGDGDNFAGVSSPFTQVVQLRPTTTTLTGSADPNNPQQVTLIAVVRWTGTGTPPALPTGTVSFLVGTGTLGSSPVDATGVATLTVALPSASASIIAIYSGDDVYATSTSLPATVTTGVPTQFTLQINPPSVTFPTKQHAAVTLEFASLSGFSDTLQLGCLGLPYAATCTFSTPQVKLGANSAADAQLTIDTGDPLGAGASATRRTSNASGVMLCLLPCLLGIAFGVRRRKFNIATSLLLLVAAAITFSSTGCSGLHINGTPPGNYTFKVTASGVNTGTTISQTMTLTVTQ